MLSPLSVFLSLDGLLPKLPRSYESDINTLKSQLEARCNTYPESTTQLQPKPPTVAALRSSGSIQFGHSILLAVLAYFFIKTYVWTFIVYLFLFCLHCFLPYIAFLPTIRVFIVGKRSFNMIWKIEPDRASFSIQSASFEDRIFIMRWDYKNSYNFCKSLHDVYKLVKFDIRQISFFLLLWRYIACYNFSNGL